jgi:hypothetical protein
LLCFGSVGLRGSAPRIGLPSRDCHRSGGGGNRLPSLAFARERGRERGTFADLGFHAKVNFEFALVVGPAFINTGDIPFSLLLGLTA